MLVIETVRELLTFVETSLEKGKKIGLVPTMGALHEGHLSLVRRSRQTDDVTIVSLFVNPTQFNNPNDLATYPRKLEEDCKLLAQEKVDVAFAPTVDEIYPDGQKSSKEYALGRVAEVMEGKFRPGHFNGVAQVVDRLFQLCRPTRAYFGMKDFQQIAVIRAMVKSEGLDVELVACPIVREESGLALSSRNQLLTPEQRKAASAIYRELKKSVEDSKNLGVEETRHKVITELNAIPGFKVEYFDIVDGETLLSVEDWGEAKYIMGCITVFVGDVRLIDNIQYR